MTTKFVSPLVKSQQERVMDKPSGSTSHHIAAIPAIHGNLPALEAVLEDVGRRGCDLIVNLGDVLSGPLQ